MKIEDINGQIYFNSNKSDALSVDNSILKDFCKLINDLNLKDFINFCKNKKITRIDKDTLKDYCDDNSLPEKSLPIINVGTIDYNKYSNIVGNLDTLLDELDLHCLNATNELNELLEHYNELYELTYTNNDEDGFFDNLKRVPGLSIHYKVNVLNDPIEYIEQINTLKVKLKSFTNHIRFFEMINDVFEDIADTYFEIDLSGLEEKINELNDFINNMSLEEIENNIITIEEKKKSINQIVEVDSIDYSKMSNDDLEKHIQDEFKNTDFYKINELKCKELENIKKNLIDILEFSILKKKDKELLTLLKEQTEIIYEIIHFQYIEFNELFTKTINGCSSKNKEKTTFVKLLDEVDKDSPFEITEQPITISDKAYWVKFGTLLTKLSAMSPLFWANGLYTPIGPIPLPTIYMNMGVIAPMVIEPVSGASIGSSFIIVPFLTITGTVISPYLMFINLGNTPVGPVMPMTIMCMFTWRSSMVTLLSDIKSEVVSPASFSSGSISIDMNPQLTLLLGIIIRDDLPPYKRLSLANIPFVLQTLSKIILKQKQTVGLP